MATAKHLSRTLVREHEQPSGFPCDPSERQGKHVEAIKYGEECSVQMCDNCLGTLHNITLDQGQFNTGSQSVLKSFPTMRCSKHPGEYLNIYSENEDAVYCSVCVALELSTCNKPQHLPDAAKGIQTSAEYQRIRKETQGFLSDLNKVLDERKADRTRIDNEMQKVKQTIDDFRKKVNKYFDDLEQKCRKELNLKEISITDRIKEDIQCLDETIKKAEDTLQQLDSFRGDNECDLFFQVKACKRFIVESAERVGDISSNSPESIVFKIDEKIQSFFGSLVTLGRFDEKHSATVQSSPSAARSITSTEQLTDSKASRLQDQTTKQRTDNKSKKSEDNSMGDDTQTNNAPRLQDQTTKQRTDNKSKKSEDNSMGDDTQTNNDTVQLLYLSSTSAVQKFGEEFSKRLQDQFGDRPIDIHTVNKNETIDTSQVLIVFCFITSRSLTDAETAIKDIKNSAKTVLVMVHLKDAHALHQLNSSFFHKETFKGLAGMFELAFLKEKGIYDCDMNKNSMDEICNCIKNMY